MPLFKKAEGGNGAKAKANGDLAAQLETLRPEHDESSASAWKAETEGIERYEQAVAALGSLRTKGEDAASAFASARVRHAEGIGTLAEVKTAKLADEELRDRIAGQEGLVRVLGARRADLREATRAAEDAAAARTRKQILSLVRANIRARDEVHERIEGLVDEAGLLLEALEAASPFQPVMSGGRIMGQLREGWNSAWAVLLGVEGDHVNCAVRIQNSFVLDPRESGGGALARWRELASEAGFLPTSPALKARREREQQQLAEAANLAQKRDDLTRARLATVFRSETEDAK